MNDVSPIRIEPMLNAPVIVRSGGTARLWRLARWPLSLALLLTLIPNWTGDPRLPTLRAGVVVRARGFVPKGGWPARIGRLEPVGALTLSAADEAFGGFSALAIHDGVVTLLSDGGNHIRLAIHGGWIRTLGSGALREGPGTGWSKDSRDSESLAVDPASGRMWVGYEGANSIWRYAPGFVRAEARWKPDLMRRWAVNSGAESLARLNDGRFLAISEGRVDRQGHRPVILFTGDPATPRAITERLTYLPPAGFAPSDAAVLLDGDLLVLNRRFRTPFSFTAKIVRIPLASIRAGATIRGEEIATLTPALLGENAEGLAVTREGNATMLWIVTDNDISLVRPTILAKFRLR
jgi:hypothetical protein